MNAKLTTFFGELIIKNETSMSLTTDELVGLNVRQMLALMKQFGYDFTIKISSSGSSIVITERVFKHGV